jgi:hypothetical protein
MIVYARGGGVQTYVKVVIGDDATFAPITVKGNTVTLGQGEPQSIAHGKTKSFGDVTITNVGETLVTCSGDRCVTQAGVNVVGFGWKSPGTGMFSADDNMFCVVGGVAKNCVRNDDGKYCVDEHCMDRPYATPDECKTDPESQACHAACATGYFHPSIGCTTPEDAGLYQSYMNDWNKRLADMQQWAAYGRALSNLFLGEGAFKGWSDAMDRFFANNVIGQFFSGQWERMTSFGLCQLSFDISQDNLVIGPQGQFALHIEGEVTGPTTYTNETGYQVTEYIYKVTFYVSNLNDNSNEWNIMFYRPDGGFNYYFVEPQDISGGGSYSGSGSRMIVERSQAEFSRVCLRLRNSIEDYQGNRENVVCNALTPYSGPATGYGEEQRSSAGARGQRPDNDRGDGVNTVFY